MAAGVMLKELEAVPLAVVTVTVPAPVVAVEVTLTGRLIDVALTVAVPAVIPVLLNLTVAPVRLVPAMVTVWLAAPWTRLLGATELIVGAGRVAEATVKGVVMFTISAPCWGLFGSRVQPEPKTPDPASYWLPYQPTFQV